MSLESGNGNSLVAAINSIEQKTGEQWIRANRVFDDCSDRMLEKVVIGEDRYIATPGVIPLSKYYDYGKGNDGLKHFSATGKFKGDPLDLTDEEVEVMKSSFRLARRTDGRGKHATSGLFLIVNDNFRHPILNFNEQVGLMSLDDGGLVLESERLVPAIIDSLQYECDLIEKSLQRSHRRLLTGLAIGLPTVAALSAGVILGYRTIDEKLHEDERKEAAADEARASFDAQNVDLPAMSALGIAEIQFVTSDEAFFDQHGDIPQPDENDTFDHPRLFQIGSEDCLTLSRPLDLSQEVRVVTDAPLIDNMYVVVEADGTVTLCNTTDSRRNGDGVNVSTLNANVAVQMTEK